MQPSAPKVRKDRKTHGLYTLDYRPAFNDRHFGATAPLDPLTCTCSQPGATLDEATNEVRCWKCGKPMTNTTTEE